MSDIVLKVDVREDSGKGAARAVRRDGKVPGVIYGGDQGPVSIAFERNELVKAMNAGNLLAHMIDIEHSGKRQPVITRDIQYHPVTDEPLHVDVFRVDENTRIDVEVPVRLINEDASPGLKRGGVLNVVRYMVEVSCPANAIPEELIGDLTGLDIGDSLHISNFPMPANVHPTITDRDFTVATIGGAMAEEPEEGEEEIAADEVPTTEQEGDIDTDEGDSEPGEVEAG